MSHLERWACIISEVDEGYPLTIDDYTNDLCYRSAIEDVNSELTEEHRNQVDAFLSPLDTRFDAGTTQIKKALLGFGDRKPWHWWWFRLPKKSGPELHRDIVSLKIIDE
jgi:hypothetical protein